MEENNEINNNEKPKPKGKSRNPNTYKGMPSFNPAGRPKGTVTSNMTRKKISEFIYKDALPELFRKFDKMSDKNQIDLITKIIPFVLPTLAATKHVIEDENSNNISFKIVYDDKKDVIDIPNSEDDIDDIEDVEY